MLIWPSLVLAETNLGAFPKEKVQEWLDQSRPKAFFEENRGQFQTASNLVAQEILFVLKGRTDSFYLRSNGWSFVKAKWIEERSVLKQPEREIFGKKISVPRGTWLTHRVDVNLVGCNTKVKAEGQEPLSETRNYANIGGSNPAEGVRLFKKVVYQNWLPNVDIAFAIEEGQLVYEFIINASAQLESIEWIVKYANAVDAENNRLSLMTEMGPVVSVIEAAYKIKKDGNRQDINPVFISENGKLKLTSFSSQKREKIIIRLKQI